MISGIGCFSKVWWVHGEGGAVDTVDTVTGWVDTVDIDVGDIETSWWDAGDIGAA